MDSARGGTESKLALHMMWLLRVVWLVVGRTRGPVPATPTGPRPQTSLYPPGKRLPTEGGSVGSFFVFRNKAADRIKLLVWEEDGYAIWYKRLEAGRYRFPSASGERPRVEIRAADLVMLLEGIDLASVKRGKRYHRPVARAAV